MGDHFEQLGVSLAATLAAYVERLEAQEAIRESEMRHRTLATQLQQANQELESFAYSVSHDLRAPLRTMQGFAHALVQNFGNELSDEARDYARRIIASGQQSEKLISDLLAYSRLSFERLELMPVELNAVVDQAREQVQADLTESQAHVTVEEPLPTVRGNVTALVQVVANLLSNAVKFVPDDRKPEVRIWSEEREGNVRLWVEDNGVGVPVGQEERIFRVFERLVESGNRPGTGIGLAIVRRGLQRVGGECGVEHLPDGGSGFWIEIPGERLSWSAGRRSI
jgi:signal transduction histidine kinase